MAIPGVDWAAALDSYVAGDRVEVVPPGWFTKIDIAKQWGKSGTYTNKILARMIAAGAAERKVFSIKINTSHQSGKIGFCRRVPHYKLIKPVKK